MLTIKLNYNYGKKGTNSMNLRLALLSFFSISLALGSIILAPVERTSASNGSKILGVQSQQQQQTNWCWAASAQSVLSFNGINDTQCGIVENVYYSCYNWQAHISSVSSLLTSYGVSNTYHSSAIGWNDVVNSINGLDPLIARWAWDAGGGHMVTIRGYKNDGNRIYYIDPATGDYLSIDFNSFTRLPGSHTWTHTVSDIGP